MTPLEIVAHHEAAHAVADHRLGLGVLEVRVSGAEGRCEPVARDYRAELPERPTEGDVVNTWAPWGIGQLAGPAAEVRIRGGDQLLACGQYDVAQVEAWLRQATRPGNYESARDWLVSHAVGLVDQEWPAIERVAQALLRHRTLSGEEVAELVG